MITVLIIIWSWFALDGSGRISADKPWLAANLINPALLKDAWSVVRQEESKYVIESPQKYTHSCHRIITILKEGSGEEVIGVPYDKYSTASFRDIFIYDPLGKLIRKVNKSEIIDQLLIDDGTFYHDARALFLKISGGRYPYTLEYSYEINYKETMAFDPWTPLDFNQSLEKASFQIQSPPALTPHTEDRLQSFDYSPSNNDNYILHTWSIENFSAVKQEDNAPSSFDLFPILLIAPSSFKVESYQGSMDDWNSFGRFLYDINLGQEKLTPEMTAKVKELVAEAKDPRKKIDILYKWMQKNTRYVSVQLGIGGWQSFEAAYVEKNKYGDCKALSTFMKGMLSAIGIESWQVVIYWDPEPTLVAKDFATSYFNHMMLHIPSENMWLECTSNYLPTGYIDKDTENKQVLLVTPDGGVLAKTPQTPSPQNIVHTIDTLYFNGSWNLQGRKKYEGNMQGDVRAIQYYYTSTDQREMFLEHFPLNVEKLESLFFYSDSVGHEAGYRYSLKLQHLGTVSNGRFFLPMNTLHPIQYPCNIDQKRNLPFVSRDNHTMIDDVYIKMPSGYITEFMPDSSTINHALGQYTLSASTDGEYIHITRQLRHNAVQLPPDQFGTICRFYEDIKKAEAKKMVFVIKT